MDGVARENRLKGKTLELTYKLLASKIMNVGEGHIYIYIYMGKRGKWEDKISTLLVWTEVVQ